MFIFCYSEPQVKKPRLEDVKQGSKVTMSELHKNEKKRRSTVKIPPTNMRTAGLEDNATQLQPKSRLDVTRKW